ncbi:hypothetical protein A2757_02355 [Candidatus Giovannonibacteria bacterium RIFCSPHIGHO2_01_FULL_48_47]|nr:MAG: hypothetical protein A2757_02355 [Candidatus Giovannonibacteria bacterium RIFCSPHIGHO2_01_FULL_48_47]OGF68528.1 MAG: hypothetical protein A3D61_02785 [Candidatus Giovannonibacteria bacterium RIFCSPHIGHO2_02_FULL_48_15]OGF88490.1 MAG: hypothetical protein A3B26_02060 [Candidatus Giovannonibacteria bacterium RIFCSPLOWO2_01_FULL_48_47]OGF95467.1 MAG: hypothetical protein A2433_00405 [Candidatus Giovannonibacteria bacterium RIFOXYC1_FULL_48_8]OGF96480.1 MAG: hypothetical protein A2613_02920
MGISKQNILTVILFLALFGIAYIWYTSFFSKPQEEEESQSTPAATLSTPDEFLALLFLLEQTKIDLEFFQSESFKELKGGIKLPPLPAERGRVNPFAPF